MIGSWGNSIERVGLVLIILTIQALCKKQLRVVSSIDFVLMWLIRDGKIVKLGNDVVHVEIFIKYDK